MEVKEKQIAFCQRVNDIYMKLTGDKALTGPNDIINQ